MDFNDHSNLRGLHAVLSPSYGHWVNYDEHKLRARLTSLQAAARGTRIHNWAHEAINLGMRQNKNGSHIHRYINDGIGFGMTTDFVICVSENAFGEADTLSFRMEGKKLTLRISDLKTGINAAKMLQLELYAAFFCLEYGLNPEDIRIILRIYQNDKVIGGEADPKIIRARMEETLLQDRRTDEYRKEMS